MILQSVTMKVLLVMGLILAVVAAALGAALHYDLRTTIVPMTERMAGAVVQGHAKQLGHWLQMHQAALAVLAQDTRITSADRQTREAYILSAELPLHNDVEMVLFVDGNGTFITNTQHQGRAADAQYFRAIIHDGHRQFVAQPTRSFLSGQPVVTLAHVVHDDEGEVLGVLALMVRLDVFTAAAADVELGESGYGYVVAQDGVFLAHPRASWVLRTSLAREHGPQAELVRQVELGRTGSVQFAHNGRSVLHIFAPIPGTPGWSFLAAVPVVELMAAAQGLLLRLWVYVGVALLLTLAAFVLTSLWISRPLAKLAAGLQALASGQLDRTVPAHDKDDLGRMGRWYTAIVQRLQDLRQRLDTVGADTQRAGEQLASCHDEQLSTADTLTAGLHDLQGHVDQLRQELSSAAQDAEAVEEAALRGQDRLGTLTRSLQQWQDTSQESRQALQRMDGTTKAIMQLVELIASIGANTHILALNAAIEGARGGEAGRGFSIVADEMHKTAQQCKKAAAQMEEAVGQLQGHTQAARSLLQTSGQTGDASSQLAETTGTALETIVQQVQQLLPLLRSWEAKLPALADDTQDLVKAGAGQEQFLEALAGLSRDILRLGQQLDIERQTLTAAEPPVQPTNPSPPTQQ